MSLQWIHENPPHWDARKQEIIGGAADGIFEIGSPADGDLLPGEWWRAERDSRTVGYGWMDTVWGDAEILLAVDAADRGSGVGTFIVEHIEREATARGLRYLYNVVRPSHPEREAVTAWLEKRNFATGHDDDRLLRRVPPKPD